MNVSVVVPFRSSCPQRDRVWRFLRERWAVVFPEWELLEGADDGDPWAKGLAAARAVASSSGEILVVIDADAWVPAIAVAIDAVRAGAVWCVPHRYVARLTERATARILAGELELEAAALEHRNVSPPKYSGMIGGGAVVIRREAYLEAPIDPRFRGWGCEDHAWGLALLALFGKPVRPLAGNLVHLWHPPAKERPRNQVDPESEALRLRYQAARGSAAAMRVVLAG